MNKHNPVTHDDPAPLDAFEKEWTALLAEREPDLMRSEDAFVQGVLARHMNEQARPAVVGRIGFGAVSYAAAAALLLTALVGWYVLTNQDQANGTDGQTIATNGNPAPAPNQPDSLQPGRDTRVVKGEASKVKLGALIAQTRTTMTQPASNLTATVRQTPANLRVERLIQWMDAPVPDLKGFLSPLKPDNEQSRA